MYGKLIIPTIVINYNSVRNLGFIMDSSLSFGQIQIGLNKILVISYYCIYLNCILTYLNIYANPLMGVL